MDENSEKQDSAPKSMENTRNVYSDRGIPQIQSEQPAKEEPSKPTSPPMPPGPIDGGLICWLQIIGSFAMWANSWGIINTFGVFQTYYEVAGLSGKSASQISWIGSLQAFLLVFVGALSGPLLDAGYFPALNAAGNFFVVFGLMMTRWEGMSDCRRHWLTRIQHLQ